MKFFDFVTLATVTLFAGSYANAWTNSSHSAVELLLKNQSRIRLQQGLLFIDFTNSSETEKSELNELIEVLKLRYNVIKRQDNDVFIYGSQDDIS